VPYITQVQFEVGDVTKREFPAESFDVIFSRDTILHIEDKQKLFSSFYVSSVHFMHVSGAFIRIRKNVSTLGLYFRQLYTYFDFRVNIVFERTYSRFFSI